MTRGLVAGVAAAAAALAGLVCTGPEPSTDPGYGRGYECTEDMDCWDCETMGNLVCGPTDG